MKRIGRAIPFVRGDELIAFSQLLLLLLAKPVLLFPGALVPSHDDESFQNDPDFRAAKAAWPTRILPVPQEGLLPTWLLGIDQYEPVGFLQMAKFIARYPRGAPVLRSMAGICVAASMGAVEPRVPEVPRFQIPRWVAPLPSQIPV